MDEADARAASKARLKQFIETGNELLLRTLRLYVVKAGLAATEGAANAAASELLNDVVLEALEHADRFDPSRQPLAWLLGIAANLIRRRQVELAKRNRREPLAHDMVSDANNILSDDEVFDRLPSLLSNDPAETMEQREYVFGLLNRISQDDQRVLRLAVLHDLDGQALARELGIQPGAARVRLHRALVRLRSAIQTWG